MAGPTKSQLVTYFDGLASESSRRVLLGQSISHQALQLRSSYEDYFLDLWTASGCFPSIMNLNWRRVSPTFSAANIKLMTWLAIDHWRAGGIPQITAFFDNPWSGGGAGDLTRPTWGLELLVDDGEAVYTTWHDYLDDFADEFDVLAAEDVVFIFRPFHECTGSWFWWGPQAANEWAADQARYIDSFVAMFQDAHDYLNTTHGLSANIIWAYTTSNRDIGRGLDLMFPGSDYADIAGCSCYDEDGILTAPGYGELQSLGVPIFFAERGRALGETSAWSNLTLWETHKADYPDMFAAVHWASTVANYLAIVSNSDIVEYVTDSWAVNRGMVTPHELVCGITFEQNGTSSFDAQSTDAGDMSTGSPGMDSTSYLLAVSVDSTASYGSRYVQIHDDYADQLHIQLYFDPQGMTASKEKTILSLTDDSVSNTAYEIKMVTDASSAYSVSLLYYPDGGGTSSITEASSNTAHYADVYLYRGSGAGASNGRAKLTHDGNTGTTSTGLSLYGNWSNIARVNLGDLAGDTSIGPFSVDELSMDRADWYSPTTYNPVIRLSGRLRLSGRARIDSV
jgi:hypothetical protein